MNKIVEKSFYLYAVQVLYFDHFENYSSVVFVVLSSELDEVVALVGEGFLKSEGGWRRLEIVSHFSFILFK